MHSTCSLGVDSCTTEAAEQLAVPAKQCTGLKPGLDAETRLHGANAEKC